MIKAFTNKGSAVNLDMDTRLMKSIIHMVTDPFTYIYNLSFFTGRFPDNMKVAKVIAFY